MKNRFVLEIKILQKYRKEVQNKKIKFDSTVLNNFKVKMVKQQEKNWSGVPRLKHKFESFIRPINSYQAHKSAGAVLGTMETRVNIIKYCAHKAYILAILNNDVMAVMTSVMEEKAIY